MPASADCAIREAAWEYGKKIQPQRGEFKSLYDALQLGACGITAPLLEDSWRPSIKPLPEGQTVIYVDPKAPAGAAAAMDTYATVSAAVAASRTMPKPLTIALREGSHFLDGAVELGPDDSGLMIRNAPGEAAVVSGGRNLTTEWKASAACDGCYEASLKGQVENVPGLRVDGLREIRARFPNHDPEINAVIEGKYLVHDGRTGWITAKTDWITKGAMNTNGFPGEWPPQEPAVTHIIRDEDRPGVEWPMHIVTNGTVDPDSWTGEGCWGEYWVGVGGTCVDQDPPAGILARSRCAAADLHSEPPLRHQADFEAAAELALQPAGGRRDPCMEGLAIGTRTSSRWAQEAPEVTRRSPHGSSTRTLTRSMATARRRRSVSMALPTWEPSTTLRGARLR